MVLIEVQYGEGWIARNTKTGVDRHSKRCSCVAVEAEITKLVWHHSCWCLLPQEGHLGTGRSECLCRKSQRWSGASAPSAVTRKR